MENGRSKHVHFFLNSVTAAVKRKHESVKVHLKKLKFTVNITRYMFTYKTKRKFKIGQLNETAMFQSPALIDILVKHSKKNNQGKEWCQNDGAFEYKVNWKNVDWETWQSPSSLNCPDLIQAFYALLVQIDSETESLVKHEGHEAKKTERMKIIEERLK